MRAYLTMEELENYIQDGTKNFLKILKDKSIEYTKFQNTLNKINEKCGKVKPYKQHNSLLTKYNAYNAVNLLIESTINQNRTIDKNLIISMRDNYNKERTLQICDKMGYDVYIHQKDNVPTEQTDDENEI